MFHLKRNYEQEDDAKSELPNERTKSHSLGDFSFQKSFELIRRMFTFNISTPGLEADDLDQSFTYRSNQVKGQRERSALTSAAFGSKVEYRPPKYSAEFFR